MAHYNYVIVGGGMTADAAVRGIREIDANGTIGMISAERHPPYDRPPLSKGLWKDGKEESIWRGTDSLGVDLHLGRSVVALDTRQRTVSDEGGTAYGYGKLLLATGGTPRSPWPDGDRVIYFRTYDDYRRLRDLAREHERFVVIGGGFIGSEIAAALSLVGRKVVMLFPEEGVGARTFPADLARFLVGYYREKGVDVRPGEGVTGVKTVDREVIVRTQRGDELRADAVVAGLGIIPRAELAEAAGLELQNGIVVDQFLRTRAPEVYAAGDVARFHSPQLGKRLRVEHEDGANTMGACAGRAMAGRAEPYEHLPFFYSDLFELGYEAVGDLDPNLDIVADWKEPYREGVVYYLKKGQVRGTLLWNTWGQVKGARELIAEPGPHAAETLTGRLPA